MTHALDPLPLAQALIRCASITPADAGAMALVAEAARAAGFAVQESTAQDASGGNRVKNLFAQLGQGRPMLAFAGHVDVVPVGDSALWHYPPFAGQLADGRLHGRGSADMKSAIAAFIAAASRWQGAGQGRGALALLITGDEEEGSPEGTRALLDWCAARDLLPDAALIGEASNDGHLGQGLRIGRRGSLNVIARASGIAGHVARPAGTRNAAHMLVHYLDALVQRDWGGADGIFPPTSLQITRLQVPHAASNVIPAAAEAHFNLRFNRQQSGAGLSAELATLRDAVAPHVALHCTISGEPYQCNSPRLEDAVAAAVHAVTGLWPDRNAGGGVSDGRFIQRHCPVVEFGLVGDTIHQRDENVAVADIGALVDIYAAAIDNFFANSKPAEQRAPA